MTFNVYQVFLNCPFLHHLVQTHFLESQQIPVPKTHWKQRCRHRPFFRKACKAEDVLALCYTSRLWFGELMETSIWSLGWFGCRWESHLISKKNKAIYRYNDVHCYIYIYEYIHTFAEEWCETNGNRSLCHWWCSLENGWSLTIIIFLCQKIVVMQRVYSSPSLIQCSVISFTCLKAVFVAGHENLKCRQRQWFLNEIPGQASLGETKESHWPWTPKMFLDDATWCKPT